jgi:hypothetical protein
MWGYRTSTAAPAQAGIHFYDNRVYHPLLLSLLGLAEYSQRALIVWCTMPVSVRKFWRSYWIAVQRSGTDRRARSFAAKASFLTLYVAACVFFIAYTASDGWNYAFYTFIFAYGTTATILVRRWHKKQDEILNTSLTGRPRPRPRELAVISKSVRSYLHERAVIIASLLSRGASEICLANQGEAGTQAQVVTRQIQNALLRERGLWPKLEHSELELASVADGQWTAMQRNQLVEWCEQLRLLRLVIGVDAEIMPLAHFPKLDFSLALELPRQQAIEQRRQTVEAWEVRIERDVASQYTARIVSELKARGQIQDNPDVADWAHEFCAKSLGASIDYLAGPKTIADLNDSELRLLGSVAAARERYAAYLTEQLDLDGVVPFSAWCKNAQA